MSFFDEVAAEFGGAVSGIADLARKVWGAITGVWTWLVSIGGLLVGAWAWVVNGVFWLAKQAGELAYGVVGTLWHIATHVIPSAVWWAIDHVTRWALGELGKLWRWIEHHIAQVYRWATGELGELWRWAEHHVESLVRDVAGAWHWIEHTGYAAAELVLHPERLAEWLAGHILVPVVRWLIGAGRDVIVWVVKVVASEGMSIAHLLEDVIADIL